MHYYWGMYFYWWFFWIFIWIVFFSFMTPMRRATYRDCNRLCSCCNGDMPPGRLTSEEYEERRTKLVRDIAA